MSRYTGGLIRAEPLTLTKFGSHSGMFSLGSVNQLIGSGNWIVDYDVILQFTETGTWECPTGVEEISEYLILGGGGGGGILSASEAALAAAASAALDGGGGADAAGLAPTLFARVGLDSARDRFEASPD